MAVDLDSKGIQKKIIKSRLREGAMPSGYEAMGMKVPSYRMSKALDMFRQLTGMKTEDCMKVLGRAAQHLEEDEPYKCMEVLFPHAEYGHGQEKLNPPSPLDLTGAYMIMSYLLAG